MAGKSSLDRWARQASKDVTQSPMGRLFSIVESLESYGAEIVAATKSPNAGSSANALIPWIACCSSDNLSCKETDSDAGTWSTCTEDDEIVERRDVQIVGTPATVNAMHYHTPAPADDGHKQHDRVSTLKLGASNLVSGTVSQHHTEATVVPAARSKPARHVHARRAHGEAPRAGNSEILHDAGIPGMSMSMAVADASHERRSTFRAEPALRQKSSRPQGARHNGNAARTGRTPRDAAEDLPQRPSPVATADPESPVTAASRLLAEKCFAGDLHDDFMSAALAAADGVGSDED